MTTESKCGCSHRRSGIAVWSDFCAVAPSPELKERIKTELKRAREVSPLAEVLSIAKSPKRLGFDDGVIIPPDQFPIGTPMESIRSAAADRAPLRGKVRVIVVLVSFPDKAMTQTVAHFKDLFFSTGVLPHGSVKEYYTEVTGGAVEITGEVVGPYKLPQTLAWYANNNFGIGRPSGTARANIMAQDAAIAADPAVNFTPYDNDGNGFVDAFIVVHAGGGGEQTGNPGDIWSHKWTLPTAYTADTKKIFAYLTIPEDARIGVCAHELGHLLFGFPDLYDTDGTSEGIGNWCLMAGGSWGGGGDIPVHPSAWCKAQQGWASVTNVVSNGTLSIPDVKISRTVHRLWKDGSGGPEYFLMENRQRTGYDQSLPGDGLLLWHIDDSQPDNTNESHYKVALIQADNKRDMELDHNRGDAGDPYPGSVGNTSFNATSSPNSNSYAGVNTCVSVTGISAPGSTMTAGVTVLCKSAVKDAKDRKDTKEQLKDRKDSKDRKDTIKDTKEQLKDRKDAKDRKEHIKEGKELFKDRKDIFEGKGFQEGLPEYPQPRAEEMSAGLEARVAALEAAVGLGGGESEAFIGGELRPDLVGSADYKSQGDLQARMASGDRDAKVAFDTMPPV